MLIEVLKVRGGLELKVETLSLKFGMNPYMKTHPVRSIRVPCES